MERGASSALCAAAAAAGLALAVPLSAAAQGYPWDEAIAAGPAWTLLRQTNDGTLVVFQAATIVAADAFLKTQERFEYRNVQYPSFFSMAVDAEYDCAGSRRRYSAPATYSLRNLQGVRQQYRDISDWTPVAPGDAGFQRVCSGSIISGRV